MSEIYNKYLSGSDYETLYKRIKAWNQERNGLAFNVQLEMNMLHEELNELINATDPANFLKEGADVFFVAIGTDIKDTEDIMGAYIAGLQDLYQHCVLNHKLYPVLTSVTGKYSEIDLVALAIVTEANEAKGTEKDENGKVIKGPNYVNPEHTIKQMLEEMGIGH